MTLSPDVLTRFACQLLIYAKVPHPQAELVAASLVAANLRGVDSHGLQLLSFYIELILMGNIDAQTDALVVSESAACPTYDGQDGIGQWIAETCCAQAIRLARAHGVGIVVA